MKPNIKVGKILVGSDFEKASGKVIWTVKRNTSHLKKRILVQGRGGFELQTGGIHVYVEDLKLESNKEIGPKDFLEMVCSD